MPKERDTNPFKKALAPPALKLQSDERLITLAREGHEQAFEAIVERYQKPLTSYCRRLLGPDLAQDAVQQTFATAYAQLLEGSGPVHLRAWLYRVAGNLSISMLRRRYTDHQELKVSIGDSEKVQPHTAVELDEEVRSMFKQLRRLPERERHALLLKATEGKSFDEIAAILGGTPEGAKQMAYRARRKLRDTLGAVLPVPLLLWLMRGGKSSGAGKGAIVASQGVKHGTWIKFAAAVLVSAGAAYGISATTDKHSADEAKAHAPSARQAPQGGGPDSSRGFGHSNGHRIRATSDPAPLQTATDPSSYGTGDPPHEDGRAQGGSGGATDPNPPGDEHPPEPPKPEEHDTTPPTTTIDSGPTGSTSDRTPTFSFSSSEPNSTFECRLDSNPWEHCSSPETLDIETGETQFRVRATDAAGNTDPVGAARAISWQPAPGPSWSSPLALLPSGTIDSAPGFATNQAGDTVAAWGHAHSPSWHALAVAYRKAGQAFEVSTPNTTIGPYPASEPSVAIDPRGEAIVAWLQYDGSNQRVWASVRPAGGDFSAQQAISTPGLNAVTPEVAMDDGGNAAVVWTEGDSAASVHAAFRPVGHDFGSPEALSPSDEIAYSPRLAFDQLGEATVAWTQAAGDNLIVRAASRPSDGGFGDAQTLSPAGVDSNGVQLAVDSANNAIVCWQSQANYRSEIQVANRTHGGDFSSTETISLPYEYPVNASIAVDDHGGAIVAWESKHDPIVGVNTSTRQPGGEFSSPERIPGTTERSGAPQIALDSNGNAAAVWSEALNHHYRARAAIRHAGDEMFSASAPISTTGAQTFGPSIGINAAGGFTTAWVRQDAGPTPDDIGPSTIEIADQL